MKKKDMQDLLISKHDHEARSVIVYAHLRKEDPAYLAYWNRAVEKREIFAELLEEMFGMCSEEIWNLQKDAERKELEGR